MVTLWDISSPFVVELFLLSVIKTCVIPTLYPPNPRNLGSFTSGQDLILGYIRLALFLGQNCMLPFLGL